MPTLTLNERKILYDDLKGVVSGEVYTDEIYAHLYSTDASLYELEPSAIVRPASVQDVVNCVKYASEHQLTVTPRGAGTGLAGESLNRGIILDFSQSMRRVLSFDEQAISVQPGAVLGNLNRQLEKHGRLIGPDPSTRNVTTIGGMVSIDSSGSHWLKYGSARNKVLGLQVVLADGSLIETSETHFHSVDFDRFRKNEIVNKLSGIIRNHRTTIETTQFQGVNNRSGYNLQETRTQAGQIDLNKLFTGSEGTLGIITGVTLETDKVPSCRGVCLLFFERMEKAAEAISMIRELQPVACDLMDRRLLNITRETERGLGDTMPALAEVMVLVEFDGDSRDAIAGLLDKTIRKIQRQHRLAFHSVSTVDPDLRGQYWRLFRRVIPRLSRLAGSVSTAPFVEDMAVPPEKMHEFIVGAQKILRKHQVTASIFAHAGHGQTHIRPFVDFSNRERLKQTIQAVSAELTEFVLECGGTISGEHGDGLSRTYYLKKQFGDLYPVFREVKRLFDPDGILNPGKIVANIPKSPESNLRTNFKTWNPREEGLPILEPTLPWTVEEMASTVRACNGCGRCRTALPSERMCPIFRMLPSEEASPRAKANLMRGVLSESLSEELVGSPEFKKVADLCVNCHQCRKECPAEVDIPKLMMEAKSQHVLKNGLSFSQGLLARLDILCKLGSSFSWGANLLNRSRVFRWFLEKMTGIAQGRKLPRFSRRSFLSKAIWRKKLSTLSNEPGPKVAYFVDAVPNWIDTELSEVLVEVMERNGISVYVPPAQEFSALSLISNGVVEKAIKVARKNVEMLAEAIRAGYHVVTVEPGAALCLTHEYRKILGGDDDVELVANNTSEICHYLWDLHLDGRLDTDFESINETVGYHWPCHQRALSDFPPGFELLKLIPKLNVVSIEKGCSGMAGTFGLMKQNYRKSLRAGWGLISALRQSEITLGTTECSACKMQMEQGTTKPTHHPLKLIAQAYGYLPRALRQAHPPTHSRNNPIQ
ncbi:MAG: FAD-linked oxidase C-terminal domain-containing protein [Planctomycetota bacterium]|nr:FAD-linked oxidase C-terminal domain-containing protein [Planctomycetota bacterium]